MTGERPLGLWMATALVIGSMIGSGVFLLPATLAPYGAASLLGWGISLGDALLLALTFARLAHKIPATGGPYVFARHAFGPLPGFIVAWSYWISIWCGLAALSVAFAGSIGAIFPELTATPLRSAACALAALWICVGANLAGTRKAGWVQLVTTLLKLLPLLLFGLVALAYVDVKDYQPFNPSGESLFTVTHACVAITLWAFLGLEVATVPAGAIDHADRTIPRATLLGTLIAGIATILACTTVIGLLPGEQLVQSGAPMADAASHLWGPAAGVGIAVVAAISIFGALNGWVLVGAQLSMAAARDGLFPRVFASTDDNGTPRTGLLIVGVLSTLLVMANFSRSLVQLFSFAMLLSTAATLLPYAFSSAAALRKLRAGRIVAALALMFSLYALAGIGTESLIWGAVLVLAGLPIYFWEVRRR